MVVGILGGGQLAQMIAQAGKKLDCEFVFLDPNTHACAFPLGKPIIGAYDDPDLLKQLAKLSDVVTFEFENVPSRSVEILSKLKQIHPNAKALEISQDRIKEKETFTHLQIPTPQFVQVDSIVDLQNGVQQVGLPAILKTRSEGYDGKGQRVIRTTQDIETAWNDLGKKPLILEQMISFDREVSQIAVRNMKGDIRFYSIAENKHSEGILRITKNCPDDPTSKTAQKYVKKILEHLNYVGTFALELFQCGDQLLANEMAPRVHNSGHWTIEGAKTSQFKNHLHAILNQPLGDTNDIGFSAMVNCIGLLPDPALIKKIPNTYFHDYGKEPRPGRKIGHVTICCQTQDELENLTAQVSQLV